MDSRPVFVFGLARSGTNLLARMLGRHPRASVALDPFLPLFRSLRNALVATQAPAEIRGRFSPDAPFQDYYFDADGPALLDTILAGHAGIALNHAELGPLRDKISARAALESPTLAPLMQSISGNDYARLLCSGLEVVAGLKPGCRWAGSKEVWVLEFVPLLARLFPEARFYVLERDPRAIVASLLALAAKDPTQAAHTPSYLRHWRKQVALTGHFERDPALSRRFRRVSFEELVVAPEQHARTLCADLDIDYTPDMLRLSADGWKGNSSFDHEARDIYSETADRWRKTLPARVVETADFLCGPEMKLTRYRATASANPAEVLDYLRTAGETEGSWRSDSGDLVTDFGGEMMRQMMLTSQTKINVDLVRRCFLFDKTFSAIRNA